MAELWILRALVFPLFVVTALTDENKDYDFREFLKEGKKIWVFNTTEPGNVTCKWDYINKIQGSNVSFIRHFKNNTEISNEVLEGVLFNWDNLEPKEGELYDSMKVKISAEHEIEEILEFVDDNGRCAVVKVMNVVNFNTDASKIWRELRVTNPEEGVKPSSECWKRFDDAVNITSKFGRKWRESYINCKLNPSGNN
uniref:Putative lipocalin-3 1 n=1 Tax=Amblyomma americanum TaxID=6943 RepID=A0A0C9RXT2_AMBAM